MKIAALVPHLKINGGNRIIFELSKELEKLGHKVTIFTQSPRRLRRTVANLLHVGKPKWISQFTPRVIRVGDFTESMLLNYDAVLSTSSKGADFLLDCKNIPDSKKYFYAMHDEKLYHSPKEMVERVYKSSINKIALSTWIKEILLSYRSDDIPVLIAPVDTQQFQPINNLRSEKEISILLLHHTYDWKGTDEGVAVVQELKKEHSQVRLILYGVRSEEPEVPHDEYHYDVPQDKLAELYSKTDIFLCPSWDEGLGMPGMEAMACKAALVTYDTGGSGDYAIDGETAFVAKRRDRAHLKEKLQEAIINKQKREKIAEQGCNFIINLPTWHEQAEKLEDYFKENTHVQSKG